MIPYRTLRDLKELSQGYHGSQIHLKKARSWVHRSVMYVSTATATIPEYCRQTLMYFRNAIIQNSHTLATGTDISKRPT